jgi:hypothetical protein
MLSSIAIILAAGVASSHAAAIEQRAPETEPQTSYATTGTGVTFPSYFQAIPQLFAGPTTAAKSAPFLAQTNPAPFRQETASFVANAPLETNLPISGNTNKSSIFQLVGQLRWAELSQESENILI